MRDTRIEILKDGVWRSLELASDKAIKYNAVINQIGKVATREISHSNTFSLPYIHVNTQALGINVFNPRSLAKAMNSKYHAKYFVENKKVREGYVVINNTNGGTININFIDEALDLLDNWGSTTYQELLKDKVLDIPADYATAIDELDDFDLNKANVVVPTSEVGTRGYHLCLFPNSLNAMGDGFQLDENEVRQDDNFNPYQSRPIWNVKAMFDMAVESYGYTPIYDDTVDWDSVETTFMIENITSEDGSSGTQTVTYTIINGPQAPYQVSYNSLMDRYTFQTLFVYDGLRSLKPEDIPFWQAPTWLQYFNSQQTNQSQTPWMTQDVVFQPFTESGNVGDITFYCRNGMDGTDNIIFASCWKNPTHGGAIVWHNEFVHGTNPPSEITHVTNNSAGFREHTLVVDKQIFDRAPYAAVGSNLYTSSNTWSGANWTHDSVNDTIEKLVSTDSEFQTLISNANVNLYTGSIQFTVDQYFTGDLYVAFGNSTRTKVDVFGVPGEEKQVIIKNDGLPTNGNLKFSGTFRGVISNIQAYDTEQCTELIGTMLSVGKGLSQGGGSLTTMRTTEEYIPAGLITFDEFGQYNPATVDLRHSAPRKTVKELLAAYMHKEGILMDIDGINKTVKFFNYGEYEANKEAGDFVDFSDYLLKYDTIKYDTDYGNQFAKKNRIGLASPFPGNTYDYVLSNQGGDSKFKDFSSDNNKVFKDIEKVVQVNNTLNPYFEYTNTGLGLVERFGTITGTLTQSRADGTTQGTFSNLPLIGNVNMSSLPDGVRYWYNLVDEAIKAEAQFLIPVDVMKNLDMSKPIYIEELGGFYIIEKIEEYIDAKTPCTIKLIKLIDDLRELDAGGETTPPTTPTITLTAEGKDPFLPYEPRYRIATSTSFYSYTPVNVELEYRKLDAAPEESGAYTGDVVTYTYDFSSGQENIYHSMKADDPIGSEQGWYEIQATDQDTGLQSELVYAYLGDINQPQADAAVQINTNASNETITPGNFTVTYNYIGHEPTSSVLSYQKADFLTGNPTGTLYTFNMPLTPLSGETVEITPADGAGYYLMSLVTNEYTWEPDIFSSPGLFIT